MDERAKQESAAVEAVARHLSGTWEAGEGASAAWLTLPGGRVALDVVAVACPGRQAKPRLRFDRVVLRLFEGLQAALSAALPDGTAAIVTVTAPIRLPAKTEAAIESRVRGLSRDREIRETMHGNAVRIRRFEGIAGAMPKFVGFVHNPETDPGALLDLTEALLRQVGAAAARRPSGFAGERWLVIADDAGQLLLEAYRHVCSQLSGAFDRILIVLARGRVETLAGPGA